MSNKEIQNLRFLLESGQRIAISTKEFEKVFDEIERLKQENEAYKKSKQASYEAIQNKNNELEWKNRKLQKENTKLKTQYNCYACDTCSGKEDYRNMKRHCENAINTVHTYCNVLKEIREIAGNCYDPADKEYDGYYTIYVKISEVLNEKDN